MYGNKPHPRIGPPHLFVPGHRPPEPAPPPDARELMSALVFAVTVWLIVLAAASCVPGGW